ncbi:MAG: hemerythrin domain-containing protein [Flavobacterium sp.]|nr:hemerythrin domain-containing protein [Flavobacterium sp.]
MTSKKPLKRSNELKPFSKDHHHGLLLGWKIRNGLKKGIAAERISAYTEWFFRNYLAPHFDLEEKYIFPILDRQDELIAKAYTDHAQIRSMITELNAESLAELADLLESHIRFEERQLFGKIQEVASEEQLALLAQVHHDGAFVEHHDEFWK